MVIFNQNGKRTIFYIFRIVKNFENFKYQTSKDNFEKLKEVQF